MLHHPTKHHPNSISHFLALHQTSTGTSPSGNGLSLQNDIETTRGTHLDAINSNIGKSFTIAAILGLKKNAAAAMDHHHGHKDFAVMNLSMTGSHHGAVKNNLMENISNRVPMAFGQHMNQQHLHHPQQHSNSALQSLQQQFQQQHQQHHANQNMPQFHSKERVKGSENVAKSKSSLKSKRVRTIFTPEQLERLEAEFERQQYMVGPERLYLAHTLQLTEAQVKVWFQNRRIKWRKHHLELTQQRLALIRHRQIPPNSTGSQGTETGGGANVGTNSLATQQQMPVESELSVCDDSMDTGSIAEGDDS